MTVFTTKNFTMESGERYCQLVDSVSGEVLFYPNLFVTTQIRNRSLSLSAMQAALRGIQVLLQLMGERGEDLEKRFRRKEFLRDYELDAICDACQSRRGKPSAAVRLTVVAPLRRQGPNEDAVATETVYGRLTAIANYVGWLSHTLLVSIDADTRTLIDAMVTGIKSRRPAVKDRSGHDEAKGLDETQLAAVFEVFRPGSDLNPFTSLPVQERNRLVFLLLYDHGMRRGELLNLRIRDINFTDNTVLVARRADQKDDPRKHQPLVKTLDRRLPLHPNFARQIHDYIVTDRSRIPHARKHDYLFVVVKSGPTQGQPLSISAYTKIMNVARTAAPDLHDFTGHILRHVWNDRLSERYDSMDNPPSPEEQEKIRAYLMGWKDGSGTAATYNRRFIRRKAQQVAIGLQDGTARLPKGMNDDKLT